MTGNKHLKSLEAQEEQRRLSKAELLEPKIVEQDVPIEKLGGSIRIRSLSGATRTRIRQESGFQSPQFDANRMELLTIVYSIVDPELTTDDLEALAKQDAGILDDLTLAVTMLNMIGQVEELKKDSSLMESSDSPSDSQND